jgi:hypothetical protein
VVTRISVLLLVVCVFLLGFGVGRASLETTTSRAVSVGSIRKLLSIVEPFGVTGDISADCKSGGENSSPPTANVKIHLSKAGAEKLDAALISAGWRRNPTVSGLTVFGQGDDTVIRSRGTARLTRIGLTC